MAVSEFTTAASSTGNDAMRFFISGDLENELGPVKLPQVDVTRYRKLERRSAMSGCTRKRCSARASGRISNTSLSPTFDLSLTTGFTKTNQRLDTNRQQLLQHFLSVDDVAALPLLCDAKPRLPESRRHHRLIETRKKLLSVCVSCWFVFVNPVVRLQIERRAERRVRFALPLQRFRVHPLITNRRSNFVVPVKLPKIDVARYKRWERRSATSGCTRRLQGQSVRANIGASPNSKLDLSLTRLHEGQSAPRRDGQQLQ